MERPEVERYNICNPMQLTDFINDINKYCTFLEAENAILSAYLQDSLYRVNPVWDEYFITTVKEILDGKTTY